MHTYTLIYTQLSHIFDELVSIVLFVTNMRTIFIPREKPKFTFLGVLFSIEWSGKDRLGNCEGDCWILIGCMDDSAAGEVDLNNI